MATLFKIMLSSVETGSGFHHVGRLNELLESLIERLELTVLVGLKKITIGDKRVTICFVTVNDAEYNIFSTPDEAYCVQMKRDLSDALRCKISTSWDAMLNDLVSMIIETLPVS